MYNSRSSDITYLTEGHEYGVCVPQDSSRSWDVSYAKVHLHACYTHTKITRLLKQEWSIKNIVQFHPLTHILQTFTRTVLEASARSQTHHR
jgi:hypothetical protein